MNATSQPYTQSQVLTGLPGRISAAIRGAFAGRGAAKRVAQAADANHRAATAWLYGQNAPRSPELIALMAANETLENEILAMVRDLREKKCPPASQSLPASAGLESPMTTHQLTS